MDTCVVFAIAAAGDHGSARAPYTSIQKVAPINRIVRSMQGRNGRAGSSDIAAGGLGN